MGGEGVGLTQKSVLVLSIALGTPLQEWICYTHTNIREIAETFLLLHSG